MPLWTPVCSRRLADPIVAMTEFVRELLAGGATVIQYRDKSNHARLRLAAARELRRVAAAFERAQDSSSHPPADLPTTASGAGSTRCRVRLIMNDRADLCLAADFDGLHIGQDDLSPAAARRMVGPERWLGVSTHNPEQVREAERWPVDYLAVGPVFATESKANPDPVIGIEGVRRARQSTAKPLVAIGGITRENCAAVIAAGANAVAVISDLRKEPRRRAQEFFVRLQRMPRTPSVRRES